MILLYYLLYMAVNNVYMSTSANSHTFQYDGFVISELELNGFMRYLNKTILRIPEKFTVIVGKTGAGKSTLLDAVTFALYKRTPRTDLKGIGVRIEDICRKGGYVRLAFMQGSKEYEVIRGLNNLGKSYVQLKADKKTIPGSIPEIDKRIEELIGLDYEGFINSTFVRQEEMKALGASSGSDRMGIFQKLFRLEIFEKAYDKTHERLLTFKSQADMLGGEISEAERRVEQELPDKTKLLETKTRELSIEHEKLQALDKEVKKLEFAINNLNLNNKHIEYISGKTRLESLGKELLELDRKIKDTANISAELNQLRSEVEELEEETKDYDAVVEAKIKLEQLKNKLETYLAERAEKLKEMDKTERKYESDISRQRKQLEYQNARKIALKTDIDQAKAFELLRNEGALKERITRIGKELTWPLDESITEELIKEREGAHKEFAEVEISVSKIDINSFVLSEINKNIESIEEEISRLKVNQEAELKDIEQVLQEIQAKITACGFGESEKKKLAELEILITKRQEAKKKLESYKKRFQELSENSRLIYTLQAQKEQLENELSTLDKSIKELEIFELQYQKIELELKQREAEKKELEKNLAMLDGIASMLKKDIKRLEAVKEEIKLKEKDCKTLKDKIELLTILKEKIFHKRGITMYAINQLLTMLTREVSDNLADMTNGKFSQVNLTVYEEGERYGLTINVLGVDGKWHDVQEFSGGQKVQINAAVRFAIAKQLSLLPQAGKTHGRMKTLFIDEGDLGSLDTEESRELFIRKLFDMGRFFDKIILITQLSEVAERFPAKVIVTASSEGVSEIGYM